MAVHQESHHVRLNLDGKSDSEQIPYSLFASDDEPSRRHAGGVSTSDVTLSAHIAGNAEVFSQILELHVPRGATVADVTWGKGVFWKQVPPSRYEVFATDLQMGVDCTDLPYGISEQRHNPPI